MFVLMLGHIWKMPWYWNKPKKKNVKRSGRFFKPSFLLNYETAVFMRRFQASLNCLNKQWFHCREWQDSNSFGCTVGIWITDLSGTWMVENSQIIKRSTLQITIWILDNFVHYSDAIWIADCYRAFEYPTVNPLIRWWSEYRTILSAI